MPTTEQRLTDEQLAELVNEKILDDVIRRLGRKKVSDYIERTNLNKLQLQMLFDPNMGCSIDDQIDVVKEKLGSKAPVAMNVAINPTISKKQFDAYLKKINADVELTASLNTLRDLSLNQKITIEKEYDIGNNRGEQIAIQKVERPAIENYLNNTGELNKTEQVNTANFIKDYVEATAEELAKTANINLKTETNTALSELEEKKAPKKNDVPLNPPIRSYSQNNFFAPPVPPCPRPRRPELSELSELMEALDNLSFVLLNFMTDSYVNRNPIIIEPNQFYLRTPSVDVIQVRFVDWLQADPINSSQACWMSAEEDSKCTFSFNSGELAISFIQHLNNEAQLLQRIYQNNETENDNISYFSRGF